jgi:hypothetical protein
MAGKDLDPNRDPAGYVNDWPPGIGSVIQIYKSADSDP